MARRKHTPVEDETPDSFESPESATIASATYNTETQMLTIYFRHGAGYDYAAFPYPLWRDFTQADSKGSFFAARIRPLYTGRRRSDAVT
jgi:hypothetical protein